MKMPKMPPDTNKIIQDFSALKQLDFLKLAFSKDPKLTRGKYLHWDKLGYYTPPEGLNLEEWWVALKLQRRKSYKKVPLKDNKGSLFNYLITDPTPERLHYIDQGAGGLIAMPDQIMNPETRDQYYVGSLIQEATTSSQLEGAVTTRQVAKEMIRTGRQPRDRSEQMILNNFRTMQHIGKLKDKPLSRELVLEIHRLIADKTLDDPSQAGRFRKPDEKVVVSDMYNEVFHAPPVAEELEERVSDMCKFANGKTPDYFLHPVIRSIILHFWLAYDHPFVDGNGRTARALFYWSMLKHGYWAFEFISISQIILGHPAKYGRAFLYTETDDNDLTYFILYHLDVIHRAIEELHKYIERRIAKLQSIERELRGITLLNHRQRELISHALRHPQQRYTIKSHQISHNVVYQTSRLDLLDLEKRCLLQSRKIGKMWYFTPTADLEDKLSKIS